ncbi:MAG: hypothetical protein ABIQ49_00995 [Gemmatimonadales bacterium]
MRRIGFCCCAVVLVACGKTKDDHGMDKAAGAADSTMAEPAGPAPIALADLNGKWKMRVTPEGSDSTLLEFTMDAKSDGWTLNFPKRPPVSTKAVADGDSIVADAGPYESALRKGQQVTTHSVYRLQDGKLIGTTVAHYQTKGADSVKMLRSEGTRE